MKKHIYLHTSNLDYTIELTKDDSFEYIHEYSSWEFSKAHRNEYGRISTDNNFYHILIGTIPQENCPWCKGNSNIRNIVSTNSMYSRYCIECENCGARGPCLNVAKDMENDPIVKEQTKYYLWDRFKNRRPWDVDFINPYESAD